MTTQYPTPASKRLRTGRISEANRIYLVTIATYQRIPVFADFALGRAVVSVLKQATPSAQTLCFVVMPDHLH
ncbi:MAG: hypothetical protein V7707_16400 [Motiliproteus sp.]